MNDEKQLTDTHQIALHALALTRSIIDVLSDKQKSKILELFDKYAAELASTYTNVES